ncbi:MAG: transporter substrate-binding domain-containing protein [Butyrivibrio sp.]|nr:transporter substrate-binding domain-containing protein [Butyrivibrio sp.]
MRVNNSLRSKIFKSMLCLITVIIMTVSFALPQTVRYSKAAPPEAEKLDDEPVEANFYGDIAPSSDIANYKNGKIGTRTVKVGYFMIDGFQMYDENYGYSGYCYDYLQKIRTYTGWDYEYIGDDEDVAFSDLYRMTVEGEIDLIGGITWTQERADKLIFCNVPIAMEYTTIFVKNGDTTFLAGDYSKWRGIRLGIVRGTTYVDKVRDFAESNYFTYKGYYYDSDADLIAALENGDIDAFVSGSSHNFPGVSILAQFDPSYLFFATGLDNSDLMDSLNHALSQIETVDAGFKESLMSKYYQGNGTSNITFTSAEKLYLDSLITNNRTFTLLANPDNCPLSYLDENGKPSGILVDMTTSILDSIGLSYEFYEVSDRFEYINAYNEHRADIVIDFISDFGRSEMGGYYECDSYFDTSLACVHNDKEYSYDTIVKRHGDGIFNDSILQSLSDTDNVVFLDSLEATRRYLVAHPKACTMLPMESAVVLVRQEETNALVAEDISYRNLRFCMAVNGSCGSFLIGIFNKACNSFSQQKRAEIIGRYDFDNYATKTFRAFIYDNPMYGFVVIAAGLVIFFLVIINHIGKRNRRKIEDLNQKLSTALDGEKKASEAKKRFFSNMSHDMRTPLNGILGLTRSVIRNGINSVNNLDYLYKIEDSANYLELLINDSLAMSNLGRIEIELNPQMCDPGQVFDSLKNVALTFARERDIRIVLRRKEIVNLPTMIDYSRLEQAILNVISNAVKFSRKSGTIEIDLTSSMIDDGKVEYTLSVQDHGIGMSSDFQKTMFDAYTQEDRGEMTDHAETGIGLSVVKSIVEKMNGRIDIKSKENIGTIVTLVFVFDVCAGAMLDDLQEDYEQKSLEGRTVLYCEDNELNMDIVCAILESENVKVEKAWTGKEGLDTYSNLPEGSLAARLMDIRMPVMDGLTAARAIRNSGREDSKTIPIIAVSANAFEDDKKASKDAGMNSHLSKPVDPKLLISEIKKYVCI